jgi:tetratricopeptide (TPR) repeat protein
MLQTAYCRIWLLAFVFFLVPLCFAQNQPPSSTTAVTAVEELAAALVTTKTEAERAALLEAKKELVTAALAQALIRRGVRLRAGQDFFPAATAPQALAIFQLAEHVAERVGDKASAATAMQHLGDVNRNQRNYPRAQAHYRKALALREALGDQAGAARSLLTIGFSYTAQGNSAAAIDHYQRRPHVCGTRRYSHCDGVLPQGVRTLRIAQ